MGRLSFTFFLAAFVLCTKPGDTFGVQSGDIVHLSLWARCIQGQQGVQAVQAFIQFDPSLLRVVDSAGNPTNAIVADPNWDMVFANCVGPDTDTRLLSGELFFSAGSFSAARNTDFLIATMDVQAIADFPIAQLLLPSGSFNRYPFRYESMVTSLSLDDIDITGDLVGARLDRNQAAAVPEPLSLCVLGFGLCALARRCRAPGRCGRG